MNYSLHKHGGTYIDLDTISLRNISLLGANFAARESDKLVANGVMNINRQSWIGSLYSHRFLRLETCFNLNKFLIKLLFFQTDILLQTIILPLGLIMGQR